MLGLRCETTFNKFSRRTRRRTTTCPEPSSPARLQRFFPRSIPRILICIASTLSSCCIGSLKLPDRRGGPFHNSCRNRHCPKCRGAASRRWLADREAELLPVAYFHVVYTLPSELRDIAYHNKRVVYHLLMKAAAETTLAIAADPKRLGARIGVTAVLHTWGSALTHHPHVHMIVPGGGLSLDNARWVASRSNFLVHVNVLALFRGKMLAMLMDAHDSGQLTFFNTHAELAKKTTFKRFIAALRRIHWVVHCKAPFAGPEQVLRYLSRYTHRVAISNRRLVAADNTSIAFRWKDYRINGPGRWKTMRLH